MKADRPNASRCSACVYWKKLSGSGYSRRACHFLLENRRTRRRGENGVCLEFQNNACKWKPTGFTLSSEEIF